MCECCVLISGLASYLGLYHDLLGVFDHLRWTLEIQIELFAPLKYLLGLGRLVLDDSSLTASWMQHRAIFGSGFSRATCSVSINSFFEFIQVSRLQEEAKIRRFKLLRIIIVIFIFAAFFFQLLNIALNLGRPIIMILLMHTILSWYRIIQLILRNRKWFKWLAWYFGFRVHPMDKSWRIFSLVLRWFGQFTCASDWALSKFAVTRLRKLLSLLGLFKLKSYSEIRISCSIEICCFGSQVFLGWFNSGGLIIGADWW